MIYKSFPATLSLVLAATLAAGSLAFAQAPQQTAPDAQSSATAPAHTPNPHRQAMRIARELNLTPDQAGKIEPIFADRDQKTATLRADNSLAPQAMKRQMRAIHQETRSELSNVLTSDQLNQFKSIQHSHPHQGQAPSAAPSA